MPVQVGPKVTNPSGAANLAAPDATWAARVGIANFDTKGLTSLQLDKLPKTADVRAVLAQGAKDPNDPASPLNERPANVVTAHRDDKSKQFGILVWQPADFMGTLHVFDNAGNALGNVRIDD